ALPFTAAESAPPQTVHLAFMSPRPLFLARGSMEVESHGEEKEEELEIEDLKRPRSFEFDYALAAERSSAAFALEKPICCWRNPSRLSLSPDHERRRPWACAM